MATEMDGHAGRAWDTPGDPAAAGRSPAGLSLADFVAPLLSAWLFIGIVAVAGGVLALGIGTLRRPVYEAVAIVRVSESKASDKAELPRPDNYGPLIENRASAAALVKAFGLVRESAWKMSSGAGEPYPADAFVREHVQVEQIGTSNLLRVRVQHSNPATAARVANELIARGNRVESAAEPAGGLRRPRLHQDAARSGCPAPREAEGRPPGAQGAVAAGRVKADTEAALALRAKLLELGASMEYERAFLAASEADLKAGQPLVTTKQWIDRDAALLESAKQAGSGDALKLQLSEEQVNDAYTSLQEQVAESRAILAGQERQRKQLLDDKRFGGAHVPSLSKLYQSASAIDRLQAEYDMTLDVYTALNLRYEDARIRVGSRGAQLQVVDPAIPPSSRLSPRLTMLGQLGVVLGAMLASLAVLARHFLLRRSPPSDTWTGKALVPCRCRPLSAGVSPSRASGGCCRFVATRSSSSCCSFRQHTSPSRAVC